MRFLNCKNCVAVIALFSIFICCSCERHRADELPAAEPTSTAAQEPGAAESESPAPSPEESESATPTPAEFFPENTPP